jgi:hypothetical protein
MVLVVIANIPVLYHLIAVQKRQLKGDLRLVSGGWAASGHTSEKSKRQHFETSD